MANALRQYLGERVPNSLMPIDVGPVNRVGWPFHYPVTMDFNVQLNAGNWEYSLLPTFQENRSFQVTADAGFLLTYIYFAGGPTSANFRLQPIQVDIIDAQSSRRMTILPMPLNSFGNKPHPFVFEKPFYLFPNARIQLTLSTFYTGATITRQISTALLSPVKPTCQLTFYGYRIRSMDEAKVLSSAL